MCEEDGWKPVGAEAAQAERQTVRAESWIGARRAKQKMDAWSNAAQYAATGLGWGQK